jgi:hypothetical protein
MIYLITDTANQTVRLSLDEGRQYYATAFTDYLIVITHEENSTVGSELAQVATIVAENRRYTQLTITTDTLTIAGRYRYEVYGQNSAVNTDPTDASVVGLIERGTAVLTNNTTYYDVADNTIEDDIIYQ